MISDQILRLFGGLYMAKLLPMRREPLSNQSINLYSFKAQKDNQTYCV